MWRVVDTYLRDRQSLQAITNEELAARLKTKNAIVLDDGGYAVARCSRGPSRTVSGMTGTIVSIGVPTALSGIIAAVAMYKTHPAAGARKFTLRDGS